MAESRIFHFAVKPGCDPVYLPSLSAHARFPWIAQGYEVFEWHYFEDQRWVGMPKPEIDGLYAFCGIEPTDPYVVSHAAQAIYDRVALLIAEMVAPDIHGSRFASWPGDVSMLR